MSDKKEARLPQGVDDAQLKKLVAKHGRVYPITVRMDGEAFVGLFRKPTLADMSAAGSLVSNDPMAAAELVYNSCKLAADPQMDKEAEVHVKALKLVQSLFRDLEGEVGEPFGDGQ